MRRRGYGAHVGLGRELVAEEHGVAIPLDLPVGACSTFLALGGGAIRELDVSLFDDAGALIAADSTPGEGGLVHVCPQGAGAHRPFHLVLSARRGTGAVLVGHFRSALGAGEGFEGIFDDVLAPRVPFEQIEEHFAQARGALRARGFQPSGEPTLRRVGEGGTLRVPVTLQAERCYVVVGRSDGVRDIDLFLFDTSGAEVARDLAADAEPTLEHCPAAAGRYTVELRAFEGAGAVGVLLFEGPGMAPAEPGVETIAESRASEPSLVVEMLTAPLRRQGFPQPIFVVTSEPILPGEVRTHDVVVGPGCALLVGAASREGIDLDLFLVDGSGREVDRDTAVHSTAKVRACRSTAGLMRVAVRSYGGDGRYALAMLRAPDAVSSLRELRLEEATSIYSARGYAGFTTLNATLGRGERFEQNLAVPAGRCVAVVAAGDDGVEDLDLFMRDAERMLLTSDSAPAPYAAVARCSDQDEDLSLEMLMFRGAGSVRARVLVFGGGEQADGSGDETSGSTTSAGESRTTAEGGAAPDR
jgi:hypothetical protein